MTILEINGKRVEVDSSFMQLAPADQEKTVREISASLSGAPQPDAKAAYDRNDPRFQNMDVKSAVRGVPIAGALESKAAAAMSALAHPLTGVGAEGESFGDRYRKNLGQETAATADFQREHPIRSAADELVGGTVATAPLAASAAASKVLGLSGSLPGMVVRGAASNAAIGAADEAARGGSPIHGAEVGAITGAGLPVAGRLIGKGVAALRGGGERPGLPTESVAGQPIPQVPNDNLSSTNIQAALSGALGPDAQRIAQQGLQGRDQALERARQSVGDQMAPATDPRLGNQPGESPLPVPAGEQAITELAQRHNDEVQANALRGIAGDVEQTQSRAGIAPGMPQTARTAMEAVGGGIRDAAQAARTARTGAYTAAGEVLGEFAPASFERISNSLEQRLNSGAPEQRVRVNDNTPRTREALQLIEDEIGSGRRPTNIVDPRVTNYNSALEQAVDLRPRPPITGRDLEAVRQQLVPLVRDANNAARAPGGSFADARAMRRLMDAFDQHARDVVRAGGFSGDGEELLRRYDAARQAHGAYRGTYSARGQGDYVGPMMEQIIGKHPGQEMTPEALSAALFGPQAGTGGNRQVGLAQRVMGIFGHQSPQGQALKQGLLSHLLDTPAGSAALPLEEQAARIREFVSGKGNSLSQVILTPEERQRLAAHADLLDRLATPGRAPTPVDVKLRRLSGVETGQPASGRQAIDALISTSGKPTGDAPALAARLKELLSPESFDSLRQGVYHHLTTAPEHALDWGPQKISERLNKFLSDPLASVLYSPKERQMLEIMAREYQKSIPAPNTTNPSGSGIFATKMLRAAQSSVLPMLGLAIHGPVGVLGGVAMNKALSFVGNRRAVNRTMDLLHGKAASRATNPNFERAAAIIAHAASPLGSPTGR